MSEYNYNELYEGIAEQKERERLEARTYLISLMLEKEGFSGIDVNTYISLFEYGMVCKESTNEVWFTIPYNNSNIPIERVRFYLTEVTEDDITEYFERDKESILSYCGMTEADWLQQSYCDRLSDVESYSGVFSEMLTYYPDQQYSIDEMFNLLNK